MVDSATPPDGASPDAPGDATFVDAPYPVDGALPPDGLVMTDGFVFSDMFTGDGYPQNDSILGLNDAGKYMCLGAGGLAECECNDSLDNDNDKDIDFPQDTGCDGPWDNREMTGTTQCTDGIDNDGDGKVDAADPECTGPLDNDESSFATGIPGDNVDPCKQDCFFDGNSGAGDDKCEWSLKCDPLSPGQYLPKICLYDATVAANPKKCPPTQSLTCLKKCLPITPNGCDCFGCCAFPSGDGGAMKAVKLTASCTPSVINDPTKCPPCTQVVDCLNPCGKCEVCLGKPAPDPSCFPDAGPAVDSSIPGDGYIPGDGPPAGDGAGPGDGSIPDAGTNPFCPPGIIYCGPGGIPPNNCPTGTFCITGCCIFAD